MGRNYNWIIAHKDIKQKECLIWPFKLIYGYGRVKLPGDNYTSYRANRIMCEEVYGSPPKEKPNALHKCNNSSCMNPSHLYWGSNSDNVQDAIKAGTHSKWNTGGH